MCVHTHTHTHTQTHLNKTAQGGTEAHSWHACILLLILHEEWHACILLLIWKSSRGNWSSFLTVTCMHPPPHKNDTHVSSSSHDMFSAQGGTEAHSWFIVARWRTPYQRPQRWLNACHMRRRIHACHSWGSLGWNQGRRGVYSKQRVKQGAGIGFLICIICVEWYARETQMMLKERAPFDS
jgi:hypothetical protein